MEGTAAAIEWDEDTFDGVLERLRTRGTIDAAGVRISPERLARILDAASEHPDRPGQPLLRDAKFDRATFSGEASFDEATFSGFARFSGATFEGGASFDGATFEDEAWFRGATFEDARDFGPVLARRELSLDRTVFAQPIRSRSVQKPSSAGGPSSAAAPTFLSGGPR